MPAFEWCQATKHEQRKNLTGAKVAFDCDSPVKDSPAVNSLNPPPLPPSVAVLSLLKASSPFQNLAQNSRHRGVSGPDMGKKNYFFSYIKLVIANYEHAWCALPRLCASCNYSKGANVHASSNIERVANWWQKGWRFCRPASASGMCRIINLIAGCLSWWLRRCWTGHLHQMGLCSRRVGVTTSCGKELNKQPDARLAGSCCRSQKLRTIFFILVLLFF